MNMPGIPELRVIIEPEANRGDWNMAADEALLESAISTGIATLRLYQWREPTISLGYFQNVAELSRESVLDSLPTVRRLSGGGAILHDNELTYSITLPAIHAIFRQPHELYSIVHGPICDVLRSVGIPVQFRGMTIKKADEPLLCFQRQDTSDVVLNGTKVLGSAQRRRRGAILQHGSLILRASTFAPQISGLKDLCDKSIPENLADLLAMGIADEVSSSWNRGFLSEFELELTKRICEQQYSKIPDH